MSIISTFAFAQVNSNIAGPITLGGATFSLFFDAGELQGALTNVTLSATLNSSTLATYASDLAIVVTDSNTLGPATILLFQGGGYSNFGAIDKQAWPNGDSSTPGTVVSGTLTLATPIDFTANAAYAIFVGNGYANANPPTNTATWSNIAITLTGVSETTASANDFVTSKFTIYPNPADAILNISNADFDIKQIGITDINGRAIKTIVQSIPSQQTNIDVSDLSAGVYFLVINTTEGKAVKKFVKN